MKLNNRFFISILLMSLLSTANVFAADNSDYLIVKSSSTIQYLLTDIKDITFTDEGINVNLKSGTTQPFSYSSINELRFSKSTTGISDIAVGKNAPAAAEGIYDLQGRRVSTLATDGKMDQSLPKGIYIIQKGNKSYKVIKR